MKLIIGLVATIVTAKEHFYNLIRDDMADYFEEERDTAEFQERMLECLTKWDDGELPTAMDALWRSTVDIFAAHDPNDNWVDCDEDPQNDKCFLNESTDFQMKWLEFTRGQGFARFGAGTDREYLSYEKCNGVSN